MSNNNENISTEQAPPPWSSQAAIMGAEAERACRPGSCLRNRMAAQHAEGRLGCVEPQRWHLLGLKQWVGRKA